MSTAPSLWKRRAAPGPRIVAAEPTRSAAVRTAWSPLPPASSLVPTPSERAPAVVSSADAGGKPGASRVALCRRLRRHGRHPAPLCRCPRQWIRRARRDCRHRSHRGRAPRPTRRVREPSCRGQLPQCHAGAHSCRRLGDEPTPSAIEPRPTVHRAEARGKRKDALPTRAHSSPTRTDRSSTQGVASLPLAAARGKNADALSPRCDRWLRPGKPASNSSTAR